MCDHTNCPSIFLFRFLHFFSHFFQIETFEPIGGHFLLFFFCSRSFLGVWQERIGLSRIGIDQARLMTLLAAHKMDTVGNKAAAKEIAIIKVIAPKVAETVIDRAIQGKIQGLYQKAQKKPDQKYILHPPRIKGRAKNRAGDQFWSRTGRVRMDGRQFFGVFRTGDNFLGFFDFYSFLNRF